MADFNLLTPDNLNDLIYTPFQQALGEVEHRRLQKQHANYLYYAGYQHRGNADELVKAEDLARPPGLDYDPTRYATNYFKAFIKRKARWQMGGKHGVDVDARVIDPAEEAAKPDYKPSPAQQAEFDRAEALETLIYRLWRENRMRERLLQGARDRLIAGRVAVKILFNQRTGKLKWAWHPDTETFPIYSEDDFEDLIACHFVKELTDDETGETLYQKQTFELIDGACWLSEGVYDAELKLVRTITPKASMGLDFIPVVLVPIEDLAGEPAINTEIDDMRSQTDVLNQMNEDAIDSLKFEMFGLTAVINAPAGTAAKMEIAPGAVIEVTGTGDTQPDVKKVEGGFRWNEAFKAQYERVKGALHEITSIPQMAINDLNFGGMNTDALHIVFHDIISETEEHWLAWEPRLQELHEKSVRYLQARTSSKPFAYDKSALALIGNNYEHEIKFALPLPDNRKDLVELLTLEMDAGLESQSGALARAGVENTAVKRQEIENERKRAQERRDPYSVGGDEGGET